MTAGSSCRISPRTSTRALKADIGTQGVLVPLVIDEDTGEVIEGHHRLRAWTELRAEGVKVPDYPKQVVRFANDDDRVAFVARRQPVPAPPHQ